jgi:flagellar basal-body rod protein FlgC
MSLINTFNIGEAGIYAHSKRMEVHANNIANIDTPNYVRKIPTLMAKEDVSFHGLMNKMKEQVFSIGTIPNISGGVSFVGVIEDPTPGELQYSPGHPDADQNGYIRRSNVNPMVDMADAMLASKAYEASIAIESITKSMAQKAVEMGR